MFYEYFMGTRLFFALVITVDSVVFWILFLICCGSVSLLYIKDDLESSLYILISIVATISTFFTMRHLFSLSFVNRLLIKLPSFYQREFLLVFRLIIYITYSICFLFEVSRYFLILSCLLVVLGVNVYLLLSTCKYVLKFLLKISFGFLALAKSVTFSQSFSTNIRVLEPNNLDGYLKHTKMGNEFFSSPMCGSLFGTNKPKLSSSVVPLDIEVILNQVIEVSPTIKLPVSETQIVSIIKLPVSETQIVSIIKLPVTETQIGSIIKLPVSETQIVSIIKELPTSNCEFNVISLLFGTKNEKFITRPTPLLPGQEHPTNPILHLPAPIEIIPTRVLVNLDPVVPDPARRVILPEIQIPSFVPRRISLIPENFNAEEHVVPSVEEEEVVNLNELLMPDAIQPSFFTNREDLSNTNLEGNIEFTSRGFRVFVNSIFRFRCEFLTRYPGAPEQYILYFREFLALMGENNLRFFALNATELLRIFTEIVNIMRQLNPLRGVQNIEASWHLEMRDEMYRSLRRFTFLFTDVFYSQPRGCSASPCLPPLIDVGEAIRLFTYNMTNYDVNYLIRLHQYLDTHPTLMLISMAMLIQSLAGFLNSQRIMPILSYNLGGVLQGAITALTPVPHIEPTTWMQRNLVPTLRGAVGASLIIGFIQSDSGLYLIRHAFQYARLGWSQLPSMPRPSMPQGIFSHTTTHVDHSTTFVDHSVHITYADTDNSVSISSPAPIVSQTTAPSIAYYFSPEFRIRLNFSPNFTFERPSFSFGGFWNTNNNMNGDFHRHSSSGAASNGGTSNSLQIAPGANSTSGSTSTSSSSSTSSSASTSSSTSKSGANSSKK